MVNITDHYIDFLYEQSEDERATKRDLIKALQSEFGLTKSDAKQVYDYWISL